jgi:hypothetical protein
MTNPDDLPVSGSVGENRVAIDYIKGQLFRAVRADGVIGSVTPSGRIHMALYSERPAIPRRQVYTMNESGGLGELIPDATVSRNSVVRELDVDIFLTLSVAESLHKWLGDRILEAKKWQADAASEAPGG